MESFDFEVLKKVDVRTVNPDTLVDINEIVINKELPKEERLLDFIRQIRNPYCFKCGEMIVKTVFMDQDSVSEGNIVPGVTLEDRIENFLRML